MTSISLRKNREIWPPQPGFGVEFATICATWVSDPLDFEAIDRVRFSCGRQIDVALTTHRAIQESIERVYGT
jgi:hypothetical protein